MDQYTSAMDPMGDRLENDIFNTLLIYVNLVPQIRSDLQFQYISVNCEFQQLRLVVWNDLGIWLE